MKSYISPVKLPDYSQYDASTLFYSNTSLCVSLSFACQALSRDLQNVAVQCACGEMCVCECVDVCLRVCQDIQPGTELLLYGGTEGKRKPDAEDNATGIASDHHTETEKGSLI